MGSGGKSSSQANQSTSNTYTDKRLVNESGIVATEGSNINAFIQSADPAVMQAAMDFASNADAINGVSFNSLLDASTTNYGKLIQANTGGFNTLVDAGNAGLNTLVDAGSSGLNSLLGLVDKVFTAGQDQVSSGQQAVLSTLQSVRNDSTGAIDQKTIVVMTAAAAAVLIMWNRKG